MPIDRLFKIKAEEVERLNRAFTFALDRLSLVDRNDPICDIVARKVVEIDRAGTRDPEEISELAAKQLGMPEQRIMTQQHLIVATWGTLTLSYYACFSTWHSRNKAASVGAGSILLRYKPHLSRHSSHRSNMALHRCGYIARADPLAHQLCQ
jgi:hypothetical protein